MFAKIVILSCLVLGVYLKKLPSFLEPCKRGDPHTYDCLRRNVEILRPKLLKGVPELYIPSFNPLVISEATLEGGASFKASFTNIGIYYLDQFNLEGVDFDWNTMKMKLTVHFDKLRIRSNYNLKGRLLILELDGSGPADGNYTDVRGILSCHTTEYTKKGKTFLKLHEDSVDVQIGKAHLQFDNLFGDNQELNDQTNKIINENIQDIISELKPVIKKIISTFIFGIVDRIYDKFSYDELFPVA